MNAPIALFTYNRPDHLRRTIASISATPRAATSNLFVFSDGPRCDEDIPLVAEVRRILREMNGFHRVEISESPHNKGLAASVIAGVSDVLSHYDQVVVFEDDLEMAPITLDYFNEALSIYRHHPAIFSISGYTPPIAIPSHYPHRVFLLPRCSSWGWATWRDRWKQVDWEVHDRHLLRDPTVRDTFDRAGTDLSDMLERWIAGKVDSWAIRFNWAHFRTTAFSVLPTRSLVRSFGCDGTGIHLRTTKRYEIDLDENFSPFPLPSTIEPDEEIIATVRRFFDHSLRRKAKRFIRKITNR